MHMKVGIFETNNETAIFKIVECLSVCLLLVISKKANQPDLAEIVSKIRRHPRLTPPLMEIK